MNWTSVASGLTIAALWGIALPQAVRAAPIYPDETFETYDAGESFLSQTNKWSGNAENAIVKASDHSGVTENGKQVLELSVSNKSNLYTPGFAYDNPQGKASFGFDVMLPTVSDSIGVNFYDNPHYFEIDLSNSAISMKDGDPVKDTSGNIVGAAATHWYRVEGSVNFVDQTFNLSVKDLTDDANVGTLSGAMPQNNATFGQIFLYMSSGRTAYVDNIHYNAIPEPTAVALLFAGAGGLLLKRRGGTGG